MKTKKKRAVDTSRQSDDTDSDEDVSNFTKLFMSKATSSKISTSVTSPESENESKASSDSDSENDQSGNMERALRRMSPSEASGDSDVEDMQRARNRMSPSEDSEDSDDEAGVFDTAVDRHTVPSMDSSAGSDSDSDPDDLTDTAVVSKQGVADQRSMGDDSDDSDEDSEEPTTEDIAADEKSLREGLADIPFEDLQKLKEKIGVKEFNRVMGTSQVGTSSRRTFKRANKNRPMEVTSKKPVSRMRDIVQVKKKVARDPRFDDLSGEFHEHFFSKAYDFIADIQSREKEKLKKKMKKETDEDKKEQMKYLVTRMTQQEKATKDKQVKQKRDREIKKKEQSLVEKGKAPFHLKKSDRKTLELAERFRELKKSGKMDKYLSKKRKKNAQKEKKKLPPRPS